MRQKLLLTSLTIFIALAIWTVLYFSGLVNKLLLPTPVEVFLKLVELFRTGDIFPDIAATLHRTIAAFLIGAFIGISVGLFMGYYKRVYSALEFIVDFFRSIPATALFPLFLLFLGIGDEAKIAAVVFATSFIVIVNTMYGVIHRSQVRTQFAKTLKIEGFNLFKKVILPDAAPHIFAGLRVAISISLIVVIVTEMFIGTTFGLGRRIIDSQLVYNIPEMYAAIILTGIIGYLINWFVLYFERKKIHWSGK
jgi:NitT/TauT family transport system permease protein